MCGIAGVYHPIGEPVDKTVLEKMSLTLQHRGPDDDGILMSDNIGLAHRRLSIIDTSSAGHQPMQTVDGRFSLVFNGEIYNYRQLQHDFLAGVALQSNSDTEVLLYMLAKFGSKALLELRGMFALALWDQVKRELLLARDPFGKKPLYYTNVAGEFIFASEVKALLAHPAVPALAAPADLAKFFLYEYVPEPETGYANIQQLPAGSFMCINRTQSNIEKYWQPKLAPKNNHPELPVFDKLLEQSVRRRMIADVPVGLFLSGGLDSATIGWYMRQVSADALHSFSVSFNESSFNEASYARLVAQRLNFTHHEVNFSVATFLDTVDELAAMTDIPLADASLVPTYVLSKAARQQVKVVLDGDGSDELLGGYGTFSAGVLAEKIGWLTRLFHSPLTKIVAGLPTSYDDFSLDFKIKKFVVGLKYDLARRNQIWLGSFSELEIKELLQDDWRPKQNLFSAIDKLQSELKNLDAVDKISLLTIMHYLRNDILVKLDRATMYASLEVRTPFLDIDLAEYAMRLSSQLKKNKAILKRLMRGRIPHEIIDRRKKGFGIPLGLWLRGPLYDWARGVLNANKMNAQGIFRVKTVNRLLQEHVSGQADHRKKLWTVLSFQLWYDTWVVATARDKSRPYQRQTNE